MNTRLKIGNAIKTSTGYSVYLNIGSWATMQKVRQILGQWLPDWPTWKATNHFVEKSYYRNTFRWDGEYVLTLPLEAKQDIERLVRILPTNPLTVE